ncbi:hypothetical protein JB92DRAFT_2960235 [Gautieria morchelliformis]|nr:hypothetical protein JB92DRAFT_2960235 [Gautieria morchelliformis]
MMPFIVFTNISFPTSLIPLTMSASAPDNSRCATDVPGEGCGEIFSRKTAAGLCARCHHLTKMAGDALEHGRFAQIPQCGDCGLASKNITGLLGSLPLKGSFGFCRGSGIRTCGSNTHRQTS